MSRLGEGAAVGIVGGQDFTPENLREIPCDGFSIQAKRIGIF